MLLFALACTEDPEPSVPSDDTAAEDTAAPDPLGGTAPLAELSSGECPDLSETGNATFVSNGVERKIRVILPSSGTEGAPVVFAWHWLGGSAREVIQVFELEDYAETYGAVIIAPSSEEDNQFEWGFWNGGADDLALYDDVRTCLSEQLAIDLTRVSAIGMSAGALWTTFLSTHRGDTLATILPFSGGTSDQGFPYQTPAGDFPAMLPYGGEDDLYGGGAVDFMATTFDFADHLVADGHFVVLCNHGLGHTIPREGPDMVAAWVPEHRFGEPSPFLDGDLSAFPDYCAVYTGQ